MLGVCVPCSDGNSCGCDSSFFLLGAAAGFFKLVLCVLLGLDAPVFKPESLTHGFFLEGLDDFAAGFFIRTSSVRSLLVPSPSTAKSPRR